MEKRILHVAVIQSLLFLGCCIFLVVVLRGRVSSTIQANVSEFDVENETLDSILTNCSNYIKIKKSHKDLGNISVKLDALEKKVEIKYHTIEPVTFSIIDAAGNIDSLNVRCLKETSEYITTFRISLNQIYEVKIRQDTDYIYLALFKPEKLYDTIVVLDPGHGGIDSGTLAIDNAYVEKELNLAIARRLRDKLEQDKSIKVYMTRDVDEYFTPKERTALINSLNPDWCISIHCNSAENLEASGVEVLYGRQDSATSKKLAQSCLNGILTETDQIDRGLISGSSIYITRNVEAPIALVEIGFLSNRQEFEFLLEQRNQEKIADGLADAIQNFEK